MDLVELRAGDAHLRVSCLGAECRSWTVGGRDLLWTPDTALWDGVAPVLFPVCGWTREGRVRVGERSFPLGLHGFARQCRFQVAEAGSGEVRFLLRDDAQTRGLYPFAFQLAVSYRLESAALAVSVDVRNRGDVPFPYAVGLHPGFRIDPLQQLSILFDREEDARVPVIAPGGLFSERKRPIALAGRRLDLQSQTFAREALCFVPARSRGLVLEQADGARLRVEFPDFANLVLWSRPGAPFLCIEPWTGYGDPEDFAGDLYEKPGMSLLGPGEAATHRARFEWQAPG